MNDELKQNPPPADFDPARVQNVLLTRLRFMGDVILTTPLVRAARRAFPNARISYLTEAPYAPLLQGNPNLDEIIALDFRRRAEENAVSSIVRQVRFYRDLRNRRFDLTIDLFGNPRSAVLCRICGARWRVGGDFRGRGRLYNIRVPQDGVRRDAISFHLRSLERLGVAAEKGPTEIFLRPEEIERGKRYLARRGIARGTPFIVLHPGATWPNKRWPAENFVQLARSLLQRGVAVFLSCGPGEVALVRQIHAETGSRAVAGDVLDLRLLASVLHAADAVVSNDCGVMHLAVAAGTPTTGIFGPGEPDIWFPYGPPHRAFWTELSCRPCHQNDCPLGTLECMWQISPQRVAEQVVQLLEQQVK